jgi:hypothetical protein
MKSWSALLAIVVLWPSGNAIAKTNRPQVAESRALFPSRVGLFVRHGAVRADPAGDPVATYWAGSLALATAYYYRTRGHTLEREYSDCKDEVKIYSPGARLVSDTAFAISGHRGRRAAFTVKAGPLAFMGPAKSLLLIFAASDRFLKFRVTYPVAHGERVEREIDIFLRSFPWPKG